MDIDADALPADIPEEQAVNQPEPTDDHDETTSKKKAPKKPRGLNAERGKGKSAERVPGTTTLPVARVKRILGADDDLQNISREALFLISIATVSLLQLYPRRQERDRLSDADAVYRIASSLPSTPLTARPFPHRYHATRAASEPHNRNNSSSE